MKGGGVPPLPPLRLFPDRGPPPLPEGGGGVRPPPSGPQPGAWPAACCRRDNQYGEVQPGAGGGGGPEKFWVGGWQGTPLPECNRAPEPASDFHRVVHVPGSLWCIHFDLRVAFFVHSVVDSIAIKTRE